MKDKKLTSEQIQKAVAEKMAMIEYTLNPCQFTLNTKIVELEKEIQELQGLCNHKFKDGICIYCRKGE